VTIGVDSLHAFNMASTSLTLAMLHVLGIFHNAQSTATSKSTLMNILRFDAYHDVHCQLMTVR
jgi:hypothetical protein